MRCPVGGLLLVFAAVACTRREDPRPAPFQPPAPRVSASAAPGRLPAEERTWSFPQTSVGRMSVVVVVPERAEGERFPVLIALHGRGETMKGPERGARGWVSDYALGRAAERLAHPPLNEHDFEGFVEGPHLALLNRALAAVPYRGLIVVCPYLPDVLSSDDPFAQAPHLAHFLVDELIPKVNAETPALGTPAATGIDGVSLGGRAAVTVGLLRPEAFGAVASLQAALDPRNASDITTRAEHALAKNPKLRLRLLTSSGDYYLGALTTIHGALRAANVPHDYVVVSGPHDYAFNRGPGALEMLTYHDRVLRGAPPP
ncbi:MAG TPA: alpha/beta hydrolase-fold protein [Polyangiaceae bacterium]|nr:alpha/beta hydrolase-fold protein [Polyangiaceae bacterium]